MRAATRPWHQICLTSTDWKVLVCDVACGVLGGADLRQHSDRISDPWNCLVLLGRIVNLDIDRPIYCCVRGLRLGVLSQPDNPIDVEKDSSHLGIESRGLCDSAPQGNRRFAPGRDEGRRRVRPSRCQPVQLDGQLREDLDARLFGAGVGLWRRGNRNRWQSSDSPRRCPAVVMGCCKDERQHDCDGNRHRRGRQSAPSMTTLCHSCLRRYKLRDVADSLKQRFVADLTGKDISRSNVSVADPAARHRVNHRVRALLASRARTSSWRVPRSPPTVRMGGKFAGPGPRHRDDR